MGAEFCVLYVSDRIISFVLELGDELRRISLLSRRYYRSKLLLPLYVPDGVPGLGQKETVVDIRSGFGDVLKN